MNPILRRIALWLVETALASFIEVFLEMFINIFNYLITEYNLPLKPFDIEDLHGVSNYADACTSYEITDFLDGASCDSLIFLADTEDLRLVDSNAKTSDRGALDAEESVHVVTDSANEMHLITKTESGPCDFFESISDHECAQVPLPINSNYCETERTNASDDDNKLKNKNPLVNTAIKFIKNNFNAEKEKNAKCIFNIRKNPFSKPIFSETDFDCKNENDLDTFYSYKELLVDYNESCLIEETLASNTEDDERALLEKINNANGTSGRSYHESCLEEGSVITNNVIENDKRKSQIIIDNHFNEDDQEPCKNTDLIPSEYDLVSYERDINTAGLKNKATLLLKENECKENIDQHTENEDFLPNHNEWYVADNSVGTDSVIENDERESREQNGVFKDERQESNDYNVIRRCCINQDLKPDKELFSDKNENNSIKSLIDPNITTEREAWEYLENNTNKKDVQHKEEDFNPIKKHFCNQATKSSTDKKPSLNHSDTYSMKSLIDPKNVIIKEEWKSQMVEYEYKEERQLEVENFNLLKGHTFNEDLKQNYVIEWPIDPNTVIEREQWKSQTENNEYKKDRQLENSNLLEMSCFNNDIKAFTDKEMLPNYIETCAIESFSDANTVTEREEWNAYRAFRRQEFEDIDYFKKHCLNEDTILFDWNMNNDSLRENIFEINSVTENGHLLERRGEMKNAYTQFSTRNTYNNSTIYNAPSSDSKTRSSDKTWVKQECQHVNSTTPSEINLEISDVTYTSYNYKKNGAISKARVIGNKLTTKPDELENDFSSNNIVSKNIGYHRFESPMVLNIDETNSDDHNLTSNLNQSEITSDSLNQDTALHLIHAQCQELPSSATNTGDTCHGEIPYALSDPKQPRISSEQLFNNFDHSSFIVQEDIVTCTEIVETPDLSQETKTNKKVHFDIEVKKFTYEPSLSIMENFHSNENLVTENPVTEMINDNWNNPQDTTEQTERLLLPRASNPFMEDRIRHDQRIHDLFREGTKIPEFRSPAFENITDISEKELKRSSKLKHVHKSSRKKKGESCSSPYIKSNDPTRRLEKSFRNIKLDPVSMINKLMRKIMKK